jgi:hypothetical protein
MNGRRQCDGPSAIRGLRIASSAAAPRRALADTRDCDLARHGIGHDRDDVYDAVRRYLVGQHVTRLAHAAKWIGYAATAVPDMIEAAGGIDGVVECRARAGRISATSRMAWSNFAPGFMFRT